MTKFRAAEWILSQVLSADRATSVVGDWMEDVPERGSIWFWSCVFRTLIAGLWNDVTNNPLASARITILALARSIFIPISLYINCPGLKSETQITLKICAVMALWYISSRWIFRRFNGRTLACFAVSLIGFAFVFARHPWIQGPDEGGFAHNLPSYVYIDLIHLGGAFFKQRNPPRPARLG